MLAGSFELTLIFLEASIVIQEGQAAPLILQLKLGMMPQPTESVNHMAARDVKLVPTG
jgi:hypothetical protein